MERSKSKSQRISFSEKRPGMILDAHAHLQFRDFDKDRDEVIKRVKDAGIFCINVGTDFKTSKEAVLLAGKHEGFWATAGLHPNDSEENFDETGFEELFLNPKTVAVGECGLDYFRSSPETKNRQEEIFRAQIRLAKKISKPLMLHCRPSQNPDKTYSDDAYLDMLRVLKEEGGPPAGGAGNVHFFVGSKQIAEKFLEMGFSFSFSGVITITDMYDEVIKNIPLERILAETDAPYAAPIPYRGKRNEPSYVKEVVKRLAELRGLSFDDIARITAENTKRVFGLI